LRRKMGTILETENGNDSWDGKWKWFLRRKMGTILETENGNDAWDGKWEWCLRRKMGMMLETENGNDSWDGKWEWFLRRKMRMILETENGNDSWDRKWSFSKDFGAARARYFSYMMLSVTNRQVADDLLTHSLGIYLLYWNKEWVVLLGTVCSHRP